MPRELIPTAIIKAMIPYADTSTAHSLDLILHTEEIHSSIEQTIHTMQKFQNLFTTPAAPPKDEYDLSASEASGFQSGNQMDIEGMILAVQAVCSAEERRSLDNLLMMMRLRKVFDASHDSTLMLEAITSFLAPEQKKQIDELLPLISLLQEGKMPL